MKYSEPRYTKDLDVWVHNQIGVAPVRIDILTDITGVGFAEAWSRRVAGTFFGVPVQFISLDDLVANKRAVGRSSDLDDLTRNLGTSKPEA